jgi:glycosyltransferase involved in cell wall biosynthesis
MSDSTPSGSAGVPGPRDGPGSPPAGGTAAVPRVSVVIPTYNGAACLAEAVTSVWSQTLRPVEVLIVDDGSTDDTVALAGRLGQAAPVPLSVLRLPTNSGGPARPINAGVRAATGDFVAVLEQDDLWLPEKLARQAGILRDHPHVAVVAALCGHHDHPGQTCQRQPPDLVPTLRAVATPTAGGALVLGRELALATLLLRGQYLGGYPGFMFRRACWERKGGVDESLRIASDYELLCWLCTQGDLAVIPEVQYHFRLHTGNLSQTQADLGGREVQRIRSRYRPHSRLHAQAAASREFRAWCEGQAYWARRAGRYGLALSHARLLCRLWGWPRDWLNLLQLPAHWLYHRLKIRVAAHPVWRPARAARRGCE